MERRPIILNKDTQEGLRQKLYIEKHKQLNKAFELEHGYKKKMHITTFGCAMNSHDSEKLKGVLEEMGYEDTEHESTADFIVYNTCAVRENAEDRVYGRIGYLKGLKKRNPNLIIALCGCMMQQDTVIAKLKKSYRHIDIVFGTHNIYKLAELIDTRLETNGPVFDIWDSYKDIVEDLPTVRSQRFKASVNIVFGCNNFCTYCIVPYVRGRERSREAVDILKEIKTLVEDGVIEITLLGQNVNSYGKDLSVPLSFTDLLKEIIQIEGLKRLRFLTSHPKDFSDELIDVIASSDKLCKSIHLPFQSGSSAILKKMNRHYTKESYLALVERIKKAMPDISLSTDIIVGFPGETEEDFQDTLDVVQHVEFNIAFTFIYSKRTGTPAAVLEEQVPEAVAKERFDRLLEVVKAVGYKKSIAHVGKVVEALIEEKNTDGQRYMGRLDDGHLVHVNSDHDIIGQLVKVKITSGKTFYVVGDLVE
jgi:tRNA-2-methylthio-N6-dimethylallyladenosine synthase